MGHRIVVVIVYITTVIVVVANQSLSSHSSTPFPSRSTQTCCNVALAVVTSSRRVKGRLLHWHPESVQNKKALPASYPGLLARFAKETSLSKREMFPDIDHMDVMARQETITSIRGEPVLLQLPVVPCYALTVHKTQALSIKHLVLGCLEGVFAQGQVYV